MLEQHARERERLAARPQCVDPLRERGLRRRELTPALEQALALAPDDFGAWTGLACAVRAAGRPAEAAHAFERALALRPSSVPFHGPPASLM